MEKNLTVRSQKITHVVFTHQFSVTFASISNLFQAHRSQVAAQRWRFGVCPAQWAEWKEPGSQAADRSLSSWRATPSGRSSTAVLWGSPGKYSAVTTYVLMHEYYKMWKSILNLSTYHPAFPIQLEGQLVLFWILLILLDFLILLVTCFWKINKKVIQSTLSATHKTNIYIQQNIISKERYTTEDPQPPTTLCKTGFTCIQPCLPVYTCS